jgi:site-specific recombinase XerD
LLIDTSDAVVEAWQRGRLRVLPAAQAPALDVVVQALLKTHRNRFKPATTGASLPAAPALTGRLASEIGAGTMGHGEGPTMDLTAALPSSLVAWLMRRGRLANPHADTNTLGAADDLAALAAFLRERAARSRHTWRAYLAELQRLATWCVAHDLGPLSDLTRQNLLVYRTWVGKPFDAPPAPAQTLSQRSQARALAVVASLYRYWHDTGYLLGNPAASLSAGARARTGFAPKRFVPAPLLQRCDDWVMDGLTVVAPQQHDLARWRRAAIWTVYRCSGARLSELEWHPGVGLPRFEIDEHGDGTLHLLGKGEKERAVPLPRGCVQVLQGYRVARGLPARPGVIVLFVQIGALRTEDMFPDKHLRLIDLPLGALFENG